MIDKNYIMINPLEGHDREFIIRGTTTKIYKLAKKTIRNYNNNYEDKKILKNLKSPCVYIAITLGGVYVGESDTGFLRIKSHNKIKDWIDVLVVVDSEGNFRKDNIKYLEHRLYELIKKAGSYRLLNDVVPGHNIVDKKEFDWLEYKIKHRIIDIISITDYNRLFEQEVSDHIEEKVDPKNTLWSHIEDWVTDRQIKYGNIERWVGWRFASKVLGEIDRNKRDELYQSAVHMFLNRDDKNLFELNDENIRRLRVECGFEFSRKDHTLTELQNFKREHLLILEKMGMVEKAKGSSWSKARITERCEKAVEEDVGFEKSFKAAVAQWRWPDRIAGIKLVEFAQSVSKIIGSNPTEQEFKLILSHGGIPDYTYYTENDMAYLINLFRDLSDEEKKGLEFKCYNLIKDLDNKNSRTSLMNWRENARHNYKYICNNCLNGDDEEILDFFNEEDVSDSYKVF